MLEVTKVNCRISMVDKNGKEIEKEYMGGGVIPNEGDTIYFEPFGTELHEIVSVHHRIANSVQEIFVSCQKAEQKE